MSVPHSSDAASQQAEQQLCGDALCTYEELPVRWTPQTLSSIASERLAEHAEGLLRTMARESAGGDRVTATQHQLADLLGVSRVTLGAALSILTGAGEVERGYGQIRLLRPGRDGFI